MRLKHLVISLLLPGAALAQPLAEVGSYGKNVGTVAVDLNRGVVNEGTALRIIDLANPASPRLAGSVELGTVPQGTFLVDGTAYVPSPTGAFSIIDISDADAPEVIATEDWVAWKQSVWVRRLKDYAYVGTCGTMEIIDLSNPSNPQRVGSIGPFDVCVDAIIGDGGFLYVATDGPDTRVRIYSLADPSDPVLIGSEPGNATYSRWKGNIAVFGDRLYVGQTDGNRVYDIADRTSPRYLRELSGEDRYFEGTFAVDRGLLYVADWENLDVWTLASPSAPTLLRGIPGGPGHQVKQVAAFEGRSLAARTHELTFADTSSGGVQSILSPTPGVGYVGTMAEANGLLYLGTGPGIAVVSLSSPTEPSLVHEMYARWSADMKVDGGVNRHII